MRSRTKIEVISARSLCLRTGSSSEEAKCKIQTSVHAVAAILRRVVDHLVSKGELKRRPVWPIETPTEPPLGSAELFTLILHIEPCIIDC